ncbi:hypothetical protein CHH28_14660 [Bacterioplanes sanyensis]|uniref:Uncharacterized protein n=1 Tax=Bacterioplanes sanyensis TaxID=1249553 RepID=A0A222FLE7_9GAMM|nr:DUF4150 domain-containing protein [Bacterioplanes sanyensis]ASP39838.1 hypothetical protein CHH28_14660 [Bacterioplanes sanyensis]
MFATTQCIAMHLSVIDVCKTPIPVPMPNIGLSCTAIPNIFNMFTEAMPDHNLLTMVPLSNGDQAGILMGVVSSTIMGPVENIIGSFKVFKSVMPATKMLCVSTHNTYNTIGITITPSQVKVMILS